MGCLWWTQTKPKTHRTSQRTSHAENVWTKNNKLWYLMPWNQEPASEHTTLNFPNIKSLFLQSQQQNHTDQNKVTTCNYQPNITKPISPKSKELSILLKVSILSKDPLNNPPFALFIRMRSPFRLGDLRNLQKAAAHFWDRVQEKPRLKAQWVA